MYKEQCPLPTLTLVADRQKGNALFGCSTSYYEHLVRDAGQVVGFRFRAGCQTVMFDQDASSLVDDFVLAKDLFGAATQQTLTSLVVGEVSVATISTALSELAQHAGPISKDAVLLGAIYDYIENGQSVYSIGDLTDAFGQSERRIQRQFSKYIGIAPKRVIDRFRMQNALGALREGKDFDLAELALRLHYFDQSHFSNAFKQMTGTSPQEYIAQKPKNS